MSDEREKAIAETFGACEKKHDANCPDCGRPCADCILAYGNERAADARRTAYEDLMGHLCAALSRLGVETLKEIEKAVNERDEALDADAGEGAE